MAVLKKEGGVMQEQRVGNGRRKDDDQCVQHDRDIRKILTTLQVLGAVAVLMGGLVCYTYNKQVDQSATQYKELSAKLDKYSDSIGRLEVQVAAVEAVLPQRAK